MDLVDKVASLEGVSLAEMLQAKEVIEAENRRREAYAKEHGGSYSISMVPADRLIAAAYVLDNYHPDRDAICMVPHHSFEGELRAVAVVAIDRADTEQADDGDEW